MIFRKTIETNHRRIELRRGEWNVKYITVTKYWFLFFVIYTSEDF